jgi:3-oxoacyl-[acyl-carrier-protein] synthase II
MTRISIQGIGVVGGFGCGIQALRAAALEGSCRPGSLDVPTGQGLVSIPAFRADSRPLEELMAPRLLRRVDALSRMGLLAARLALTDAGLAPAAHDGLGVIVASGFGATATTYALLDSMIQDGDPCTSPTHFAGSLHCSATGLIAMTLGATGPNLTVSQFGLSVASALLTARQWLLDGRATRVLFGAMDELSDLTGYDWFRRHDPAVTGPMRPLSGVEASAVPGEGAAFFLLERGESSRPGYCTLESVVTGSGCQPKPAQELLILGADGRRDADYLAASAGAQVACYTPLYGCMPAGPAFDLAMAALILKEGQVFATPSDPGGFRVAPAGPLEAERVSCLALTEAEEFGRIDLQRPR